MRTIYLDLDGTILNVKERLYVVYTDTVTELGGSPVPITEYWRCKRAGLPENTIVRNSRISDIRQYTIIRRARIESSEYLGRDCLLPGAISSLQILGKSNHLVLATMRTDRNSLLDQLLRLKVSELLDEVLSRPSERHGTKAAMISKYTGFDPDASIIVGDTAGDIWSGKSLGIRTIAVLSGVRGRNILTACKPDRIIKDISCLVDKNGGLI